MPRDYEEEYEDENEDRPRGRGPRADIPNYLVQSILVTLCCCLPFGVVAIIYAAQVNSKVQAGDIAGAREASEKAKMWSWIAFGVGIVVNIIAAIAQVALQTQLQRGGGGFR